MQMKNAWQIVLEKGEHYVKVNEKKVPKCKNFQDKECFFFDSI